MSQPGEGSKGYVYRRVASEHIDKHTENVSPQAFRVRENEQGLSVFRADIASPYDVINQRFQTAVELSQDEGSKRRLKEADFLRNNPDVESIIKNRTFLVVAIPIEEIEKMGFQFGVLDENGHLNVEGSVSEFKMNAPLLAKHSRLLSVEECLRKELISF